jgi:YgiT-type zinc finger domain-containing protein
MKHEQLAGAAATTGQPGADDAKIAEPAMTCTACGHGELVEGTVTTVFRADTSFAVVRDIPALICPNCHEEYIDDVTATRIDLMRSQGFAGQAPVDTLQVPVYAFSAGRERTT